MVEEYFRERELRVVFATTTLAFGVNLPADSVIVDAYKFVTGEEQGQATVVPLNWREYDAMSGRAGRYGHCRGAGRSLLLAESEIEAESLWQLYVKGEATPLTSQLKSEPLADIVLDLFAAKTVHSGGSLKVALQSTLAAQEGASWSNDTVSAAIARLVRLKLLSQDGEELRATALGETCKACGLSVESVRRLSEFLEEAHCLDRLSWLVAVASLAEAAWTPVYLTCQEERARLWRKELLNSLSGYESTLATASASWLTRLAQREQILGRETQRQLKMSLALLDWCDGVETLAIEAKYSTHFGALLHLSETISWLLHSAAKVARTLNCSDEFCEFLKELAFCVAYGHEFADTFAGKLFPTAEERDLMLRLAAAGMTSREALLGASHSQLSGIVGEKTVHRLKQSLKEILEAETSATAGEEVEMPMLRLRGSLRGDRVPIRYAEEEIDLTPKSFSYLFKLSAWRLLRPDGWVDKDEIEPGFNQAKNIYRVKQELKRFATGLEKLIENNKSGSYRINLQPEQIRIDYDSMESFCDMELLNLSRRLQQRMAS